MEYFWEKSREYLRAEELQAEFEAAVKAKDEVGKDVLACVDFEIDTPRNARWLEVRQRYLDAQVACFEASQRYLAAREAFKASPAGKAQTRYFADPLAIRIANGPDFYDPANAPEFVEAAE